MCRNRARVLGTRTSIGFDIWRTRECPECLTRFKTIEVIDRKGISDYIRLKVERE